MAVIINDFEITTEAPRQNAPQGGPRTAGTTGVQPATPEPGIAYPPNPLDILRIEEHQFRRRLRLWAH